ncbi:MAG: cadmium-translocating P-type ATPase [Oscillospiraceae bacterium]|nr:cadmium-translocating P-type ATPase [Oscillospiraceae bacterium]
MNLTKTTLSVRGMHCAVCVRNVEVNVSKLHGVESAVANLPNESATVIHDADIISEKEIIKVINSLGYKASLLKDKPEDKNKAKKDMANLIISLIFAALLFTVAMGPMLGLFALPSPLSEPKVLVVIEAVLTLPVIVCGFHFYTSGFKSLFKRSPNMDTLVAIGTLAALLYSIYSSVLVFMGDAHAVHSLYFESSTMIIALVKLGKFLEKRATNKTSAAVKKLVSLVPDFATVIRGGEEVSLPVSEILPDDIVVVRPGERIPVDGVVVSGETETDEAMITGESLPVPKKLGDEVIGGCINLSGYITFRATRTGEDTTLANIVRTVSEAQASKAPIARLADAVAGVFVPCVLAIAFIAALCWYLAGKDFSFILSVFISVLVISCPCALGLATPVAIMVGTGLSAEHGILFRNGAALEHASKIDTVVFDKTGTLTTGKAEVTDVFCNIEKEKLLSIAASAEKGSEHILGRAIVSYAEKNGISVPDADSFAYAVGKGVSAVVDGEEIYVGNASFAKTSEEILSFGEKLASDGKTPLYVSTAIAPLGVIAVADTPKETSLSAIKELQKNGTDVYMLTGDNEKTAKAIAELCGIENVESGLSPEGKSEFIKKLIAEGHHVCMVGDGINDAPALASASVSVTVASGTDIAAETSDVVLIKNDLRDIPKLIRISKLVTRNIKQNLFWAFAYNVIGIPVAAGVLYALGGPLLNPMFGAAAMSLSSITVVSNALRIGRKKF